MWSWLSRFRARKPPEKAEDSEAPGREPDLPRRVEERERRLRAEVLTASRGQYFAAGQYEPEADEESHPYEITDRRFRG